MGEGEGEGEEEDGYPPQDVILNVIDFSHIATMMKQKDGAYLSERSESIQHEFESNLDQYSIAHFLYDTFERSMVESHITFGSYHTCLKEQEDITQEQQTDFINYVIDRIVEGMMPHMRIYVDACVKKHGTTIEPRIRCILVYE